MAAVCLAFALLLVSLPPMEAEAKYTYTIRIFSGQQGTIGGGEVIVYSGLDYGSRVNFNLRDVTLNDNSKYYVKGIRQSGRDNNTAGTTSFKVTEDRDYVVAYGLLTEAVAYTINYLDAAGNPLLPSETYYGNVGDQPVIAYLYIEGYQPQAYNLTRTLSDNAAENVFDFIYTPVPVGGVVVIPGGVITEEVPVPGGPAAPGGDGEPGGGEEQEEPGGDGEPGGEEQEQENENIPDPDTPQGPPDEPDEQINLDDPEVPQGAWNELLGDAFMAGVPLWGKIALALLLAVLAGGFVWSRIRKKKGRKA
ncbi:MAG TPA: hypothetical protein DCZ91_06265 [Lachnospiraceae bacterium]|nr:hypothetical protein [Lachnospiraceae bacterium]